MDNSTKQQFDIDVYFTIRYYAEKHGYPYIRYFDVDANGIRCASKSWEILEVRK